MNDGLLEAARSIRPYLDELLGPAIAANVDAELAALLEIAANGVDVDAPLEAVLRLNSATSVFLDRVRDDGPHFRPPEVLTETTRGYSGLPGDSSPVAADKYCCPHGDFVWFRMEIGVPIPRCPTHGFLEPSQ